jgi:hypothetical protein
VRVKVGDQWFEVTAETPIMVELSELDKLNIAKMNPNATKYACFAEGDPMTWEEQVKWAEAPGGWPL